jgi:hypothetical protein
MRLEGLLGQLKNHLIGNRTPIFPDCISMPQVTTLPRVPDPRTDPYILQIGFKPSRFTADEKVSGS